MTRADSTFSYTAVAKSLRNRNVSIPDKLALCESLLSNCKTLTPHPASLVLQHVLYILQGEDGMEARSTYWQLLVKTLQSTVNTAQYLQLPSDLFSIATKHLTGDTNLQHAVLTAMHYIQTQDVPPLTPKLAQHTELTAAVMNILKSDTTVEPFASLLLTTQAELQEQSREEKHVQSLVISHLFIPLLSAPDRLRHLCDRIITSALFTSPSHSQTALLTFFESSVNPELPKAAAYALRAYVSMVRSNAKAASHGKKRPLVRELPKDVSQILVYFRDVSRALHRSTLTACEALVSREGVDRNVDSDNKPDETVRVRTAAIKSLFETAHELGIYRPSYDTRQQSSSRSSKKGKGIAEGAVAKKDEGREKCINIGKSVAAWFSQLVSILKRLYSQPNPYMDAIQWLTDPVKAILTFSLDAVSGQVGSLLASIITESESTSANYIRIPARVSLLVVLIHSYCETRSLPTLFKNLTNTPHGFKLLGIMTKIFQEEKVQKELAEAIEALPRGQSEQCVRELMISNAMNPFSEKDVPSCSFLVALILEATSTSETSSVLSAVREVVFPVFSKQESSLEVRCGSLYLLASVLFSAIRTDMQFSSEELQSIMNGGLVSAALGSPFHIEDGAKDGVLEKLLDVFSQSRPLSEPSECFTLIRFVAVLVHAFAASKSADHRKASMQRALGLLFKWYEELSIADTPELKQRRLFYDGSARVAAIPIIGSLSQMLDYSLADSKPPVGFFIFLGQYAERYDASDSRWDEFLETTTVQQTLPAALERRITNYSSPSEHKKDCEGSKFGPWALFELIQRLPSGYISENDEKSIAKCVEEKYKDLWSENSQEQAFRAILGMKFTSLSCTEHMMPQALQRRRCDWILKRLVEIIRDNADGVKKTATGLIDSLFESVTEASTSFSAVGFLARNVHHVVQDAIEKCVTVISIEGDIVDGFIKIICPLLPRIVKDLTEGQASSDSCMCLKLVSSTLGLRVALRELMNLELEYSTNLTSAVAELDRLLRKITCPSLTAATDMVSKSCKWDSNSEVGREVLLAYCGNSPTHKCFWGSGEVTLITLNLCVQSLRFIGSEKAVVRTVGMHLLTAIICGASNREVREIGVAVTGELRRALNIDCSIGNTLSLEQAVGCVRYCEKMRGIMLAAATLLCGGGMVLNEGLFEGFVPVRKQHNLMISVKLDKETTGDLVSALLELGCKVIATTQRMDSVRARDRDALQLHIRGAKEIAWKSASICVQSAELAIVRRAPYQMDARITHEVLVEISNLLFKAEGEDEDVREESVTAIASVCRAVCHIHGTYSVPHAICGLLRTLIRLRGSQEGKRGKEICGAYMQLATAGNEVVQGALIDACQGIAEGSEGLDAGGQVVEGMVKLVGACGESGMRCIMHSLSDNAKNILRVVREVYMSERYRGK